MIDWTRVELMKRELGDADFSEIAELFLAEAGECVARIARGGTDDWEAEYHFLKSSALNVGFAELARLCQQAESRARVGEGGLVDAAEVARSYAASRAAFEAGMAHRGGPWIPP